jgi:hypothetical protein
VEQKEGGTSGFQKRYSCKGLGYYDDEKAGTTGLKKHGSKGHYGFDINMYTELASRKGQGR